MLVRDSHIETTMRFRVNITAADTIAEVRRHLKKASQSNLPQKVTGEVAERHSTQQGKPV